MCCRGTNLFPAFMEYIKTTDKADEDKKREALVSELKSIDADLKQTEGPYVGGQDVNAADLKLGPQLKHVIIGAKAVKVRYLLLHNLLWLYFVLLYMVANSQSKDPTFFC